jgi:polynucleotide 5'-kinase involved in rRNA processing
VAMEDALGFTIGLGIVLQIDRICRQVTLHSPVPSVNGVDAIRLGDVTVDPETFEDRIL